MKENNMVLDKIIFWIELALFLILPFVVWWANTPTNILNSNYWFELLETIGILGSIILLAGMPVGIIGITKAKRMIKLRKTTLVLSIINLAVGSIEILIILAAFCAVVFGGASV